MLYCEHGGIIYTYSNVKSTEYAVQQIVVEISKVESQKFIMCQSQ